MSATNIYYAETPEGAIERAKKWIEEEAALHGDSFGITLEQYTSVEESEEK